MREFIAKQNDQDVRLSRFVERVTHNLPRGVLYKSFRNKRVKVNGARADADYRIQTGDVIQLYINDEFFEETACALASKTGEDLLHLVWQDEKIAILYKPAGVLCHSDNTGDADLASAFVTHQQAIGEYDPQNANGYRPALCNRLDRGTEGLVVAAKTYASARDMNALIAAGHLEKSYLCIAKGTPPEGVHKAWLLRDKQHKLSRILRHPAEGAKEVITEVKIREKIGQLALCEVRLHTGRTHQIRAHLASLGTPLLGDKRYGRDTSGLATNQALCAWKIRFCEDLPENTTLSYLAGRIFTCDSCDVLHLWQKPKNE